jgi:hypothetical protein
MEFFWEKVLRIHCSNYERNIMWYIDGEYFTLFVRKQSSAYFLDKFNLQTSRYDLLVLMNGFRRGTTCLKCLITLNIVLMLSVIFLRIRALRVRFSGGFGTYSSLLCGTCLIADINLDISLCVQIWRWTLLCMLNGSSNQMSGLLVPSKPWIQWMGFSANHLPIL